jgi:hypothetical protein
MCLLCSDSAACRQNSRAAPRHPIPDDCCYRLHACARPRAPFCSRSVPFHAGATCRNATTAAGHHDAPDRRLADKRRSTTPPATCHDATAAAGHHDAPDRHLADKRRSTTPPATCHLPHVRLRGTEPFHRVCMGRLGCYHLAQLLHTVAVSAQHLPRTPASKETCSAVSTPCHRWPLAAPAPLQLLRPLRCQHRCCAKC